MLYDYTRRWKCFLHTRKYFLILSSTVEITVWRNEHNHEKCYQSVLLWQWFSDSVKRKAIEKDIFKRPSNSRELDLVLGKVCWDPTRVFGKIRRDHNSCHFCRN